jgi:CDP-glucose 4,6-dehydratase
MNSANRRAGPGNVLDHNNFFGRSPGFWLNRRVLITGHTSFLGSWLAARLSRLGADLVGFARAPASAESLFARAGLAGHIKGSCLDLRDRARVEQAVIAEAPEIVFHLATRQRLAAGLKRPVDSFDTNATGTLNLLQAVRRTPEVRALVVVTGEAVYGPASRSACEATPIGGETPVAASLACAEQIVACYRATYLPPIDGIGLATLRPVTLIGGGDATTEDPLGRHLRRLARGSVAAIPPAPELFRPFLHVLDALAAGLGLAEALALAPAPFARAWNLAPPDPAACRAAIAAGAMLPPSPVLDAAAIDGGALAEALGWRPLLAARTAIDWTLEGHRRFVEEADGGFLFDQIDRFATRQSLSMRAVAAPDGAAPMLPAANAKASDVLVHA